MQERVLIIALICILPTLCSATASTLANRAAADISPLTLTPTNQRDYAVANTPFSFTASKPIQPTGITFGAQNCTFDTPSLSGQTVAATLLGCMNEGDSIYLTVTVLDVDGNVATKMFTYYYLSELRGLLPRNTQVTANTALTFKFLYAAPIQLTDITFFADGCAFDTPQAATQLEAFISATLLSCTAEGPFWLTVTALDKYGNPFTSTTSYDYVSVLPVLIPATPAGSTVTSSATLSFNTTQLSAQSGWTFVSPDCSFDGPTLYLQTISGQLWSCAVQGTFTLTITSYYPSFRTFVIDYVYDGAGTSATIISVTPPNSRVKDNTLLSFTASGTIQYVNSYGTNYGNYYQNRCTLDANPYIISGPNVSIAFLGCPEQGPFSLYVSVKLQDGTNALIKTYYAYDTNGPTFVPSPAAHSPLTVNTAIVFTTNEPIQSANVVSSCNMATTTWSDQTITTTLLNCPADGPISLTITASDMLGNSATQVVKYLYSSVVLTFAPSLLANTTVKPITVLSFMANVAIQPANISFVAPGCTLGNPSVSGQAVMAFLVGCFADGPFTLIVTASDMVGNTGSHVIDYVYDSMATTITLPPTPPPDTPPVASALKPSITDNSPLSFTTTDPIQPTGVQVVAPGCTFSPSTVQIQTITTTLLSCSTDGPISLTVSVLDQNGNTNSQVMDYIYHSTTVSDGVNATLQNTTLQGDVQLTHISSSTVTTSTHITIEGCATLGGHFTIQVPNLQQVVENNQTFIEYGCYGGGQFETITLEDPETNTSCSTQGSYLQESFNALVKSCESDGITANPPDYTGAIIGGVVGGVALLALIAVLIICFVKPIHDRMFPHHNRAVDMDEALQPTHEDGDKKRHRGKTLGSEAIPNSMFDNQGRSGENPLFV